MRLGTLRIPTFLFALAPLVGCLGTVDDLEQGSAGLSRERDAVSDVARPGDAARPDDGDRFERCTRDWDCRPGDFCLAPDGDDRGDRPDVHYCGREPQYSCETDRECGRGAECVRGDCVRLRDAGDDGGDGCDIRHFRAIAARIRNAVDDGTIRPARARRLWLRLAKAVADQCGDDARDPVRDDAARDAAR